MQCERKRKSEEKTGLEAPFSYWNMSVYCSFFAWFVQNEHRVMDYDGLAGDVFFYLLANLLTWNCTDCFIPI